ncbi:MAG TPA: lysylphosphatidylglycerol synthase transmembrane domain-containing protein [Polyangia bacterium]|nr:lysylphosphatidylglycerol synthase transmembrane domain-containing protein [Polyangia bacterium]
MNAKMLVKITLSLVVGGVCVYLAVRGMNGKAVLAALRALSPGALALYAVTLAVTHLFRAWRWEFLLRPVGISVPFKRILAISSVGFMAILALPVRLGEFVRPYFVTRERGGSMTAALGTVAVERIVDGLLISILFFGSYLLSAGDSFTRELRVAAWASLVGFVGLTTFLALARVWTDKTIAFALRVSLLHYVAPARAEQLGHKLRALISGFNVLADHRNFGIFLAQSIVYWGVNGFGMWILARQMNLPISIGAAFTTMAVTGIVLTLPNSPGLVGQFEFAIKLGLGAYLPATIVNANGLAYGIVLHGAQTVWYVGFGLLALPMLTKRGEHASLSEAVRESNRAVEEVEAAEAAADEALASREGA